MRKVLILTFGLVALGTVMGVQPSFAGDYACQVVRYKLPWGAIGYQKHCGPQPKLTAPNIKATAPIQERKLIKQK